MNTSEILFRYLPIRISKALHSLPENLLLSIDEIRLRKDSPISATAGRKNLTFDECGRACPVSSAMCATTSELLECVSKLTEGSRYTCDEFIAKGFIPLSEGGRAGICGRSDGKGGIGEIYSVSIRLHRLIPDAAKILVREFAERGVRGTLVCAPPAMGKATFLRSAAFLLSRGEGITPMRVCVADERCEIAPSGTLFGLCDILSGIPKAEAITMLTRTMSPEIIICDEITDNEADSVLGAQNTGVSLIASAHCTHPRELIKKGRLGRLVELGVFSLFVTLGNDRKAHLSELEA